MPITNVTLRHSKKGEVETTIIEFHLSERERPYSLYVNNFTDIEGLKNQLSGLAHIIPPVEAAEQLRALDTLCCEEEGCKEPAVMSYCETHAP
jgi:hypothetical protein